MIEENRKKSKPIKIIHTPYNVCNNPYGLSRVERKMGCFSRVEVLVDHGNWGTADHIWSNGSFILDFFMRWPLMLYALLRFDVIHYNNGAYIGPTPVPEKGSFSFLKKIYNLLYAKPLEGIDVKLAALFGKKIFVTFQGSDGRLIGFCKENYEFHGSKEVGTDRSEDTDELRIRKIELFNRYANKIYALNPDLLHNLPKNASFMPYVHLDPLDLTPAYPGTDQAIINIVHAPSNRIGKGTKYLFAALDQLRDEGVAFNLDIVEGVQNDEALKIYAKADLVVDQLLSGWYGGFSMEVMAMGKPVICYIREGDLVHLPEGMAADIPIINANPDTLLATLRHYLTDGRSELRAIGEKSRSYAIKWHSPVDTVKKVVSEYLGTSGSQIEKLR